MTITEAAVKAKKHPGSIRMAVVSGKLKAEKVQTQTGHYWVITESDLQAWLKGKK